MNGAWIWEAENIGSDMKHMRMTALKCSTQPGKEAEKNTYSATVKGLDCYQVAAFF